MDTTATTLHRTDPIATLPSSFRSERFRFVGGVLGGQRAMRARWRECVATVGGVLGMDQLDRNASQQRIGLIAQQASVRRARIHIALLHIQQGHFQ